MEHQREVNLRQNACVLGKDVGLERTCSACRLGGLGGALGRMEESRTTEIF